MCGCVLLITHLDNSELQISNCKPFKNVLIFTANHVQNCQQVVHNSNIGEHYQDPSTGFSLE